MSRDDHDLGRRLRAGLDRDAARFDAPGPGPDGVREAAAARAGARGRARRVALPVLAAAAVVVAAGLPVALHRAGGHDTTNAAAGTGPSAPVAPTPAALPTGSKDCGTLVSSTPEPDGSIKQVWKLGTLRGVLYVPPPGFDPLTATDAQLARFGFPPRPSDPAALARWKKEFARYQGTSTGPGCVLRGVTSHQAVPVGTPPPSVDPGGLDAVPTGTATPGVSPGRLTGQLMAVGGPAGTPNRPLPGTVTITNRETGAQSTASAGPDGDYVVDLPAGTYTIVGHSPQYGDGTYPCRAAHLVTVHSQATVRGDVSCQEW